MSRLQTDNRSSMSSERHTRSLREVHERLVSYIQAHSTLGKATLSLADSIVDFYLPQVGVKYNEQCSRVVQVVQVD